MELSDKQKQFINAKLADADLSGLDDLHEEIMDEMIDENIIDLSDDESGDLYESYSNITWEYIQTKL